MNTLSMSGRLPIQRRAVSRYPDMLGLSGALAGLVGGIAMTIGAALLDGSYGYDIWFQLKVIASLVLGPAAIAQAGFVAGAVLVGLLIHLAVSALLGALFGIVTRQILRLPSDFGIPPVTGLVFGLLIWLAAYFVVPALAPQLMAVYAPAFIIQHIIYGTVTSTVYAVLRPQPYATSY
jgi:Family of unknown function (DUF6789)